MPTLILRREDVKGAPNNKNTSKPAESQSHLDSQTRNLIITLAVLAVFATVLAASLYAIRRQRLRRKEAGTLPSYDAATRSRNRSRLTISTNHGGSSYLYSEKQNLIDNSAPMPLSPDNVPEIRITFPEEEDEEGRRVSGQVVVVKVGEAGVGFVRPLQTDDLPPYQQQQPTERFHSVDMDRIGGLKELK